ncbi:MAG: heat-shock protein Hsp20 [Sphingobacteriia bacterium 24-36-13]|jgi:HSP20 family protein|uniref:Hsp20/alpha crystallin family protein n=1 Tax=Sediminibacterium sp. TaxID=1917865 RepID=UPI000BCA4B69|nr:Hsp20/alpha crystallin family protein [Sediminibacterium sp.]OYZ53562.1 MAG: heat-shock protein Hsp20 [Sphingobacteriia bacterium 24-36-13]OZA64297.1 MAG: heat-shock protein Hsp20 [Sphingobacteriia bacterium 39-36-14]HQS24729.1 Hsp20/alpha crystallin family protein [Sediminibacterium sp.]HQS35051.1 Hsp20/alpha crystallin family protein [Sediminibacterium sp.]
MSILKQNNISVFDELFNAFPSNFGSTTPSGYPTAAVNIHETTDAFHLELNAPGRNKEDFAINVDKGLLTISFEKKETNEEKNYKTIRKEFTYKSFKRTFSIDENINVDGIQARYENGVLKLLLPKKEEVKNAPKQIAID